MGVSKIFLDTPLFLVVKYILLFEMTVVVVLEACKVVAVSCMSYEQLAVLLYAKRLVNSLCSLELFACRADREDVVVCTVDDKELAWCYQSCEVAHIAELKYARNIVACAVVNRADTAVVRAECRTWSAERNTLVDSTCIY